MYETFYGLSDKPFQLNPDPSFYFDSRGHRRAMSYLEYGLHQSEGFIVITGEVGAGKTTLVRSLLQKLDPEKVIAAQLVTTQLDAEDILRMVSAAFGLRSKRLEKADILLGLEMFLVSLTAVGKRALLIVDEAQNLTPRAVEELRMLSNFQLGEHALLQSFLVGQPEFRETMQSESMQQLRQRVIASYHLGPMDADETRAYIEHRLSHVRWKGDPRFEPSAYEAIFTASGGVPRRINTVCDRVMLFGFLSGRHVISLEDVDEVLAEMRDEAGDSSAGGDSHDDAAAGEALATPQHGVALTRPNGSNLQALSRLPRIEANAGTAAQVREVSARFQASRLEERIVRLEKTMTEALELLNHLVYGPDDERGKQDKGQS